MKTAAYKTLDDKTLNRIIRPWTGAEGKSAFYRQIAQAHSKYTDEIQDLYSKIKTPILVLWGKEVSMDTSGTSA